MADELSALRDRHAWAVAALNRLDVRRRELKLLIRERNRQPGVSKETVDRLQAKDARYLELRLKLQRELGDLASAIRQANEQRQRGAMRGKVGLAVAFQTVVRRSVSKEQYAAWLAEARTVPGVDSCDRVGTAGVTV
jgi:hypothetical protein